jgi:prolyl 4-hydroxylase
MVTPKKGRALAWKNLKDDGSPDYESLHAGLPVLAGTKWIAVVWIRENKFD